MPQIAPYDLEVPNLNAKIPAAPPGYRNAVFQSDQGVPVRSTSGNLPNVGGVELQTGTSYTLGIGDQGQFVPFNNSGVVSVTLDSTITETHYFAFLANLGTGTVTLTPSSGNINGVGDISLDAGQGVMLFFDGTNWWAAGFGGAGGGGGGGGLTVDVFTPNSSTTAWTLSATPSGAVLLFWNGLAQEPGVDFTVSGTTLNTITFTAATGDKLFAAFGTGTGGGGGGGSTPNFLQTSVSGWNEEWQTSSTNPANTTPFGLYEWDASNWVAGAENVSIRGNPGDPNHYRYLNVETDGASNHGARVLMRIQQPLTTGAAWQCRIIFKLNSTTNIRALAGFGYDEGTAPLAWFLGIRYDTTLGTPDVDFMFGAGASDGSSGSYVSSGVAADTNWHDALITWISNTQFSISLDGGAAITVTPGGAIDGSVGLFPSLLCLTPTSTTNALWCNKFAFQYTGLTR